MAWPRTLGHPGRDRSIEHLADLLRESGGEVKQVRHRAFDAAAGDAYDLVELVATYRPAAQERFVLATHFDTRPWADEEVDPAAHAHPVPGANDGTSGVAVLLELVPLLLRDLPNDIGFDVVLFDGEELGRPGQRDGYCMGSRHLAEQIRAGVHPSLSCARFGIVLDMVGDTDLSLPIEPSSLQAHPQLVRWLWSSGAELGYAAFDPTVRERAIVDDHRFLTEAGIPSVLIIDRDYAAWHTRFDTIERVSAASLATVGDTIHRALVRLYEERPSFVQHSGACPMP